MTAKQRQQYNRMIDALRRISAYQTLQQLQKNSCNDYGIEYYEHLEMAYENIQEEARNVVKGMRKIII